MFHYYFNNMVTTLNGSFSKRCTVVGLYCNSVFMLWCCFFYLKVLNCPCTADHGGPLEKVIRVVK